MESVFSTKAACCGCAACSQFCPSAAIQMEPDEEGFLYPKIYSSRCTNCGACKQVCPFLRENNCKNTAVPHFYAACHRNIHTLQHSTSGGAFTALSDIILKEGGVIYGADFDAAFHVVHTRAQTSEGRNRMCISKYAQSEIKNCFSQVKTDLSAGKKVLFTGTPCQNAGLKAYLGKLSHSERLFCCDLICHSIPSPLIWEEYKKQLEHEHGGAPIRNVFFRSKKDGWSRAGSNRGFQYYVEGDGTQYEDDRFYLLFFGEQCMMRPCCEHCPYTDVHRVGDITIADYWGIEKYSDEWVGVNGVSLILISTEKGEKLFEKAKPSLRWQERDASEQLTEQNRLTKPAVYPPERALFWSLYQTQGFPAICEYLKKKYHLI